MTCLDRSLLAHNLFHSFVASRLFYPLLVSFIRGFQTVGDLVMDVPPANPSGGGCILITRANPVKNTPYVLSK